jgi:hypothetical protein
VLVSAGVASVFSGAGAGAGAVAGAGAGAVSVFAGSAAGVACDGVVSVVAVGWGSSFLGFFLKRPLNAFFIWSIASSAGKQCISWVVSGVLAYQVRLVKMKGNLRTPGMVAAIDWVLGRDTN